MYIQRFSKVISSPIYVLWCIVFFLFSCNETAPNTATNTESAGTTSSTVPALPKLDPLDRDPFFTENLAIHSAFGPKDITRNILQDKNGYIWFASWEGIIRYASTSTSLSTVTSASLSDHAERSRSEQAFTNFTNKEGLRRYHIFSVFQDRAGNLWFGTVGAGVYRANALGTSFTNLTTKDGLVEDRVGCIFEDNAGNMWFGTEDGVSRYDGSTFTNFKMIDDLGKNRVSAIMADKSGKIWFGARSGVFFYDPTTPLNADGSSFTIFKNEDGSPFNNVRSIIEDKNGNLWFAGGNGLCRYNPSATPATGENAFTTFTTNFVGVVYEDKKGSIWMNAATSNNVVLSRYDPPTAANTNSKSSNSAKFVEIWKEKRQIFCIVEDNEGFIWIGTERGVKRLNPSGRPGGVAQSMTNFLEQ
jgi:ligand-binding sensor domain-containing protein